MSLGWHLKDMKKKYRASEGKELVTLRMRKMKDGGQSLLLDYMIDGVRTREFLKMYLVPERNPIDRIQNQETLKLANAVKAKRILEIQQGRTGIKTASRKDMLLTDWVRVQQQEYTQRGKPAYVRTLQQMLNWLEKFGRKTTLLTIDKKYILDFCKFMRDGGLSDNTVNYIFVNMGTMFNNAYKAELIPANPISKIELGLRPKRTDTEREYLTLEEVKSLVATECGCENIKRAFLFSCFTGLRLSDIEALTWDRVKRSGAGLQIEAKQIKTQKVVYIPLSANALAQLPKVRAKSGNVFNLPARSKIYKHIEIWMEAAGITKHITFHCARHTYATMLLTYGANLYTVSSLLGHTNVQTTQIYAKIVDENKRKTVDLIPDIKI